MCLLLMLSQKLPLVQRASHCYIFTSRAFYELLQTFIAKLYSVHINTEGDLDVHKRNRTSAVH